MEIDVFSLKLDQIPLTHFYIYFWTETVLNQTQKFKPQEKFYFADYNQ